MKFLSYGRQDITSEDIDAVVKVLQSDFLTQGPSVQEFEDALIAETGGKYATVCCNGTAALHLAMLAAGIKAGDRVVVPAVTFVASANCASYIGAEVVFSDIDEMTACISPDCCEAILQKSIQEGKPVKAIVTVDLAGHPCDMEAFTKLKEKYGFIWIQDACHSIGGSWKDSQSKEYKVGEWYATDMTAFSFHPVKNITTGEGGAIMTNSPKLDKKLKQFRTHGITKDSDTFLNTDEAVDANGNQNQWYYEMQSLGYNYRMTDMQAALGSSQIKRLKKYITRRQEIVKLYKTKLGQLKHISFCSVANNVAHAYHLMVLKIDYKAIKKTRSEVMSELRNKAIGTQVHYTPIPMMPFYAANNSMKDFPNSMKYYEQALSIPCFPTMTDDDVIRVCLAVTEVVTEVVS